MKGLIKDKMEYPILSVLVITYNQEDYIAQTLDSIINQKHNFSYEIIVGEDCSSDNTRKILLEYKEKYPTIIRLLLNETNIGLIKNYYNVINHCKGKYIMVCAGDDYWLPGKVAEQISFMEKHPDIGFSYGNVLRYIVKKNRYGKNLYGIKDSNFINSLIINFVPAVTMCVRNSLLKSYIMNVDPIHQDWFIEDYPIVIWFAYNSKIHYHNKMLAVYRIFEESQFHTRDIEKKLLIQNNLKNIRTYFFRKYLSEENDILLNIADYFQDPNLIYNKRDFEAFVKVIKEIKKRKIRIENKFIFFIKKQIARSKTLFLLFCYFRKNMTHFFNEYY